MYGSPLKAPARRAAVAAALALAPGAGEEEDEEVEEVDADGGPDAAGAASIDRLRARPLVALGAPAVLILAAASGGRRSCERGDMARPVARTTGGVNAMLAACRRGVVRSSRGLAARGTAPEMQRG